MYLSQSRLYLLIHLIRYMKTLDLTKYLLIQPARLLHHPELHILLAMHCILCVEYVTASGHDWTCEVK